MAELKAISPVRIILVNMIPVLGVLFFDWDEYWICLCYVLETLAIYVVFELDYYFIDRHSRFPIVFALIQFFFTMIPMLGLMVGTCFILYWILEISTDEEMKHIGERVGHYIGDPTVPYIFAYMVIVELIAYYLKKVRIQAYQIRNMWRVIRRIIYTHIYIIVSLVVLSILPQNILLFAILFIGLKITIELSINEASPLEKIREFFSPIKTRKK